jgi:hypothetical protein
MSDQNDLARQVTGLALRHMGAALVQIGALLAGRDDDASGCGCDEPTDSPRLAEFTWEARFASDVQVGAVLSVAGRDGARVVRVTERRESEHSSPFGGSSEAFTFLVMDLDSEEPGSLMALPSEAMRVGVVAPDSPEGLGGTR